MNFNWLDWTLLCLIAVSVMEGVTQGFSRLVIGLITTLTAILLAAWTYGVAGSFLLPYVSSQAIANIIGFLVVFTGIQILGAILGWAIARVFKWTGLSWMDRGLGAAFGLVKGSLFAIAFVMVLTAFPMKVVPDSVAHSQFAPYAVVGANVIAQAAPKELRYGFERTYERLRKFWAESVPDGKSKMETATF